MRQLAALLALLAATLPAGCSMPTTESMGSRLRFDKVPPQHEPVVEDDSDEFNTANVKSVESAPESSDPFDF